MADPAITETATNEEERHQLPSLSLLSKDHRATQTEIRGYPLGVGVDKRLKLRIAGVSEASIWGCTAGIAGVSLVLANEASLWTRELRVQLHAHKCGLLSSNSARRVSIAERSVAAASRRDILALERSQALRSTKCSHVNLCHAVPTSWYEYRSGFAPCSHALEAAWEEDEHA